MADGTTPLKRPGGAAGGETLKRLVSGFFLVPLIVAIVLYAPVLYLSLLIFLVTLLALLEYRTIASAYTFMGVAGVLTVAAGSTLPLIVYLYGTGSIPAFLFAALVMVFTISMIEGGDVKGAAGSVGANLLGILYIALPLSLVVDMRGLDGGSWWIIFVLAVIWTNDACAYYAGRTFGSRRLAPVISPKKTVEGAVAGVSGGALAGIVFADLFSMGMGALMVFVFSFFLGIAGILGDLSESLIKRAAGVKDSGSIIPGHGGMLDRIDSLIFALPLAYFFLLWLG